MAAEATDAEKVSPGGDGASTGLRAALGGGTAVERDGAEWHVTSDDATRALHEITSWSLEHDVPLDAIEVRRPTLEDAYLELVGERAVHAGTDEAVPA